jgi:putative copper export protein
LVRIACDSFWFGTMTMLLVVVRSRDERQPMVSTKPSAPSWILM